MWAHVRPTILRFEHSSGGLVTTECGSTPRASDPAGLGWPGLRICISGKFPGDADAAGLRPTL